MLEIILRILAAYMQACKVYLQNHMQTNPVLDNASQNEQERRDLKNALIAAQDSAVVQILLECCLPKDTEKVFMFCLKHRGKFLWLNDLKHTHLNPTWADLSLKKFDGLFSLVTPDNKKVFMFCLKI